MPQLPPQGAPAPQGPAPQQQREGGAAKLIADANSSLMQLMDLMDKSPAVDPADKQKLGAVIQGLHSFVDDMSQAPGAKKPAPAAPPMQGPAPAMAGAGSVKPVL